MSRHVHADIIKAWLDGEKIQVYRGSIQGWQDYFPISTEGYLKFHPLDNYRIKPKESLYKVAVFSRGPQTWVGACYEKEDWEGVEKWTNFSHWATEPFTLEKK